MNPGQWLVGADGPFTSAFPAAITSLADRARKADLDTPSLRRPLRVCDVDRCRGMCCYDGVYLDDDEPEVLTALVRDRRDAFERLGLALPDAVVVHSEWRDKVSGTKTAVRTYEWGVTEPPFPTHFDATVCVFHLDDGRCALQVLSAAEGRHPWHYKPTSCWLHPLDVSGGEVPVIRLVDEATDPYQFDGYDGYVTRTGCGQTAVDGTPAAEVLSAELAILGGAAGRDLVREVAVEIGRGPRHES